MSVVNVPASNISGIDLYKEGREIEKKEHLEAETSKHGTLRGGSSGCIIENGEVYGVCHRKALARYKGYQPQTEEISYTWFDAGYANEDAWEKKLSKAVKSMGESYILKSEEECPTSWDIDGIQVTGRPDFMIFKDGSPYLGFELKVVCAVNSAVNIYCEDKPKVENLIQAAHYSMIHSCPFNLIYSYRSRSRVPGWAEKHKNILTLSYEKTFVNYKTGKSFTKREYTIEPFIKEFKVGFKNDKVYYIKQNGDIVHTPITGEGIKSYYKSIIDMEQSENLKNRLTNLDLEGNKLPYNPCDYCVFREACDQFEHDYQSWLDKIAVICEESKNA